MWIPYDSSMVLGGVVDDERLKTLMAHASLQRDLETAEDNYNAAVRNKLSIDMSVAQLSQMKMGGNYNQIKETFKKLHQASGEQEMIVMESLLKVVEARRAYEQGHVDMMKAREQTKIGIAPESPMNYDEKLLNKVPTGTPGLKMDVQYFKCEKGYQQSRAHVSKVVNYTREKTKKWWGSQSSSINEKDTESHMNQQVECNEVMGTLVISANATHKLAHFYDAEYDAAKLLRAWNMKVQGSNIELPGKVDELYDEWTQPKDESYEDEDEPKIAIITGQTYGSAFVGFIHFVRKSETTSNSDTSKSNKLPPGARQARLGRAKLKMDVHHWWNSYSGSSGLDGTTASEIKNMFSNNEVSTHISVQTFGIIPSIASKGVSSSLKKFAKFDPIETNNSLAAMASQKKPDIPKFEQGKRAAIAAGQVKGLKRAKIEAVLAGIGETDKLNNQEMTMNSMMLAFDDYTNHVKTADGGTPLAFFISEIRRSDVISAWMKQFRPIYYRKAMEGRELTEKDRKKNANIRFKQRKSSSDTESRSGSETETETETETESNTEDNSEERSETDFSASETEQTTATESETETETESSEVSEDTE